MAALLAALATPDAAHAACTTTDTAHCLQGKRFRVEVEWLDFVDDGGDAHTVPGGTADSGLFYFYGPNNWEMLVKILDSCGLDGGRNDHYWVFAAAATTLQYTLFVTDTLTGAVRTYSNPLGVQSPAITDTEAFATCSGKAVGAQVRYYNNLDCPGSPGFTSTLDVDRYSWQSFSQAPSPYQIVTTTSLGTTFTETNESPCGGMTYHGTLTLDPTRQYAIAQTIDAGERVLLLLDEGLQSASQTAATRSAMTLAGPPAGRVVQRIVGEPLPGAGLDTP